MSGVPGIILTTQFSLPGKKRDGRSSGKGVTFSSYVDYIKREEALVAKDNLSSTEQQELGKIQNKLHMIDDQLGLEPLKKNNSTNKNLRDREAEALIKITKETGIDSPDFSKYIGYMSRENALRKKEKLTELEKYESELITSHKNELLKKYSRLETEEEIINRRSNEEEIAGTFSIEHNKVTGKEIKEIRNIIDVAEEKGSVMWQDVISFDNNFLEEHGLYNSETKELNEEKIKDASHKMMDQFIKKEKLNDPYWFASIHRNTDNIHVHFSTVEKNPSRRMMEHDGEIQPRGKRKQSTIDSMKSSFGNELLEMNEYYRELSNQRNESIKYFKEEFALSENEQQLLDIMQQLNKRLPDKWEKKVQMNRVSYKFLDKETKGLVDEGVKIFKKGSPKLNDTINDYHETLNQMNEKIEDTFGKKENPSRTLKEQRERDFNERLGNAFLKSMGAKKRQMEQKQKQVRKDVNDFYENTDFLLDREKKIRVYYFKPKNEFKKYGSIDKFFWKLEQQEKRKTEQELEQIVYKEKRQALSEYEQMMEDVEKAKTQRQYQSY